MPLTLGERGACATERSFSHIAAGSSGRAALRPPCACAAALVAPQHPRQGALSSQQHNRPLPLLVSTPVVSTHRLGGPRSPGVGLLSAAAAVVDSESQPATAPEGGERASRVQLVHSPEEWDELVATSEGKLVILMCKAKGCRPCKMFGRKYARFAEEFTDTIFAEIFGDESKDTRQLMIKWQIKATPTFRFHRGEECVASSSGINEDKLRAAIIANLQPGEAGKE